MQRSEHSQYYAVEFKKQLESFVRVKFDVEPDGIREDLHSFAFLSHCVTRPIVLSDTGRMKEGPLTRWLPHRVRLLQSYCDALGIACPMGERSMLYATALRDIHAPRRRSAPAMTPADLLRLVTACDRSKPRGLQMKALLLLLWDTWARPSEILRRRFPDDLDATDSRGIIIRLPTSKTKAGTHTEYLTVAHSPEQDLCSICALSDWLRYLGSSWKGQLFPGLKGFTPTAESVWFKGTLKTLVRTVWGNARHYSPYSLRRGGATAAAALGWSPEIIKNKLRHGHSTHFLDYVDSEVMLSQLRA